MSILARMLTLGFALLAAFPSFSTAASAADEATIALKAYWAVRDSINSDWNQLVMQQFQQYAKIKNRISSVTTPGLAADQQFRQSPTQVFSRDIAITKVENERQVSIVAVIKNVTPIPAGGVLNDFTAKRREEGARYKYIVERASNDWRVAELWEWNTRKETLIRKEPNEGTPFIDSDTHFGR